MWINLCDWRWPKRYWCSWRYLPSAGYRATSIWSAGITATSASAPTGTCSRRLDSVSCSSTRPSIHSFSTWSTTSFDDTSTTIFAAGQNVNNHQMISMHFSSKTCGILSCELSTQLVGLKIQTCSHKASFVENTKATRRIRYDTIEQFNVDSKAEY